MTAGPCYRGRTLSRLVPLMLVLAAAALSEPALGAEGAEEAAPERSMAEQLFDQGLADMQAGRYEAGCSALAESYRLEPLPGALFTLAECETRWGRLATALTRYREYLSQIERMSSTERERQREREKVARAAIENISGEVPKLTIVLGPGVPAGSIVKRQGTRVLATQLGEPIPVDPGTHEISLEIAGEEPKKQTVALAKNESKTITLERSANDGDHPPNPEDDRSTLRTTAYVVGGIGVAGIIVGTIAGAIAINRSEEIDENCSGLVCNETGISKVETVREAGTTSTIGLVIGAAGVAAGITLYFLSEPADDPLLSRLVADAHGFGFSW